MTSTIVNVENVIQKFKMGSREVFALNDVSLTINKGDFVAIIGPSGSGKSTLLNLIGGLEKFTSGEIEIAGIKLSSLGEGQLSNYRMNQIGFIFQSFNLIPTLSAFGNVELPLIITGLAPSERKKIVEEILTKVGLADRMDHNPTELSGGEQQRVAVARALVKKPHVVLADEPTGNLDTKTSEEIINLLKSLNKDKETTFIVVTHDLEVAKYADKVISIRDGRIVNGKEK